MATVNPVRTPNPSLVRTHCLKTPILHSTFNPQVHTLFNKRITLSFTISSKLKASQDVRKKKENVSRKIVLSDSSPPPLKNDEVSTKVESRGGVIGLVKRLPRRVLSVLSNLPLAIGEMAAIAALMALGMLPSYRFTLYRLCFPFFCLIAAYWFLVII